MATGQADGTVYINTKLDLNGFQGGSKELEAAARRAASAIKGLGDKAKIALQKQVDSFAKANSQYEAQRQKVLQLQEELARLSKSKVKTQAFKDLSDQIRADQDRLDKLRDAQESFLAAGGKERSSAYRRRENEIDQLTERIRIAKMEQQAFLERGQAYQPADTSAVQQKLAVENEKLAQMQSRLTTSFDSLNLKLNEFGAESISATGKTNIFVRALQALGGGAASIVKGGLSRMGSALGGITKSFLKFIPGVSLAQKALSKFNSAGKSQKGIFGSGLKTILKYAFGIRSLYILVRKLRTALIDGFKNLAQFDSTTNASISSVSSALLRLKNSLATAFAPILNVVAPILTTFINMLSEAANYVAMFMATLTGQKSYTKAIAVQKDYAAGLRDTASAANEASDAQNEYLSGLDEIQKWDSGSSGGSGGGGGGGGGSVDPSQMFETVELPNTFNDIAEKIKEAWNTADFTEIGTIVGTKIKDALGKIPWEGIQAQCEKIAKSVGTFINGFLETPGLWDTVGYTVAQGFNTALGTVKTFIDTVHWDSLGAAITTTLQSTFVNFDWGLLTGGISSAFSGLLDFIRGLVQGINWRQLPRDIVNAIVEAATGFDFKSAFKSVGALIGAALIGAIDLLAGLKQLIQDTVDNIGTYFSQYIEDAKTQYGNVGEAIIVGIFNGIVDFLKSVGTWIKENIFDPFIDGFKSAFGIHSPAKNPKIVELGTNLIKGIFNGIIDWMGGIKTWAKKNILDPLQNAFDTLGKVTVEIYNKLRNTASSLWNSFKSAWGSASARVVEIWNQLKNVASTLWNGFKTAWGDAKNHIVEIWNQLKNAASSLWNSFKSAWGNAANRVVEIGNNLKNTASSLWSSFRSAWGDRSVSITNSLKNTASSLWSSFSSSWGTRSVSVSGTWKSNAASVVSALWNVFQSNWGNKSATINARAGTKLSLSDLVYTNTTKTLKITSGNKTLANAKLAFAARGGIVDGATLFGGNVIAGEAGKEAIIPLERHTEWINRVAEQIVKILSASTIPALSDLTLHLAEIPAAINGISDAIGRTTHRQPVMASGAIVPPKAATTSSGDFSELKSILASMKDTITRSPQSRTESVEYRFIGELNRRVLFDEFLTEAELRRRQTGRDPFGRT